MSLEVGVVDEEVRTRESNPQSTFREAEEGEEARAEMNNMPTNRNVLQRKCLSP